jgi:hypothetical protein
MRHAVWKRKPQRGRLTILLVLIAVLIAAIWIQHHTISGLLYAGLRWHPFVGLFIAILAFLGIILSLREHVGRREKAVWIVAMLILVCLEIRSMYLYNQDELSARSAQFSAFSTIEGKYDQLQKTVNNVNQFVSHPHPELTPSQMLDFVRKQLAHSAQPPEPTPSAAISAGPSVPPANNPFSPFPPADPALKAQGLQVANEINDWVASNLQDAPVMPRPPSPPVGMPMNQQATLKAEVATAKNYTDRLDKEWNEKFASRVGILITGMHISLANHLMACGGHSDDPRTTLGWRKSCGELIEQ